MAVSIRNLGDRVLKLFAEHRNFARALAGWSTLSQIKPCDVVVAAHDGDRGYEYHGLPYAQIADTVKEQLERIGLNVVSWALPYSRLVGKRAFGAPISLGPGFARATLLRKIKRTTYRNGIVRDPVVRYWNRALVNAGCKVVLGIQPPKELCRACHELGIVVVDLQHGVLSEEGYYSEEYRGMRDSGSWPDYIACWDSASAIGVARLVDIGKTKTIVVGNPWLERFIERNAGDGLVGGALAQLPPKSEKPVVLVTLQWKLDGSSSISLENMGLSQAIIEAIQTTRDQLQWWIRVHPVVLRKEKGALVDRLLESQLGQEGKLAVWRKTSTAPLAGDSENNNRPYYAP